MSWLDALSGSRPDPRPVPGGNGEGGPAVGGRHDGRPGDDFNERTDWADILLPLGAVLHHEADGERYWTRPGKDRRDGYSATTGYADDTDRLKVFTPHWPPFADGEVYTKFGAYALLSHGGDHQAAARELSRAGYGSRPRVGPPPAGPVPNEPPEMGPHPADRPRTDGSSALAPVVMTGERRQPDPVPWEDLVPLGTRVPLPVFPVETLPDYVAYMVTGVATEVQVPADLPGALALGVLSAAAGGRAEVEVRGQWREPLNLYTTVAMPPGSGKSPAFRLMCAPVYTAESKMREAARENILAAEVERETAIARTEKLRREAKNDADLAEAVKAANLASAITVPVVPRLTADDVVPEQAATIMTEQGGRLAILSAEGTFFSVIMGRYTSGTPNLELVLKAHVGDRVQVDRRGRAELIERPALTIATTVQPSVLRELAAKPTMRERGILARFLMSLPRDLVGHREITPSLVTEDVRRDYNETVEFIITEMAEWTDPAVIPLTPGALKLHTEFRAELEPRLAAGTGDLEALRDWASKLPGAAARIAGLLHLAENPRQGPTSPVSDETMGRAITQAHYWAEHAMAAFGAMRAYPAIEDAQAVLDWIGHRETPTQPFTKRDVHRSMVRRFPKAADVAEALAVLVDHGHIRLAPAPPGPGRKPVIYEVHPKAVTN